VRIISNKIGIPRALIYHYYYPAWEIFFKDLGMEVVFSPETNKKILDQGVKIAVDDLCLPFKVYYGHVLELKDQVNYLFVPRLVSLGKGNAVCPKFMGLPDMLRASIKQLPPLIEPVIDLRHKLFSLRRIAHQIGKQLGVSCWRVERAYWKALNKLREFRYLQKSGFTTDNKSLMIAVLGHSYIINDQYISMDIINHLQKMGAGVITMDMLKRKTLERAARQQPKKLFWIYNREIMGAAYYFLSMFPQQIQGIIQVTAFGCGPDSLVKELVDIKGKKNRIAILNINVDEHSGEAGLITRLEAFIDLLERRKWYEQGHVSPYG